MKMIVKPRSRAKRLSMLPIGTKFTLERWKHKAEPPVFVRTEYGFSDTHGHDFNPAAFTGEVNPLCRLLVPYVRQEREEPTGRTYEEFMQFAKEFMKA